MTEPFIETPAEPAQDWLQLFAAILLGLAATLTALSAYNAALADGDALKGYSSSTQTLSRANSLYATADQVTALDQQLFINYATAAQKDEELAAYLQSLMRPELQAALDWWSDPKVTADTPFDVTEGNGNPYTVADFDDAIDLDVTADEEFAAGQEADDLGDKFELSTVFFALTLFFGGVATLFTRRYVSLGLLGVGVLTLLIGTFSFVGGITA